MTYKVHAKEYKTTETGESYTIKASSENPDFQATILAVTGEDFARVKVGDTISTSIQPVELEAVNG